LASVNKIKLYPIDFNKILVDGNSINLECDPSFPSGWEGSPGVKVIGGNDVKINIGGSNVKKSVGGSNVKGDLTDPKKVNR
jgi:hypothetical protein